MSILHDHHAESATPCPAGLLGCSTEHDVDEFTSGPLLCHSATALLTTRSGLPVQVSAQLWSDGAAVQRLVGLSVAGGDDAEFDPDGADALADALRVAAVVARSALR